MPDIYAFNVRELISRPDWYLLKYNGPRSQQTIDNRLWVRRQFATMRAAASPGFQLDEFPFASTEQGGQRGPAKASLVEAKENRIQGGYLSVFYRWQLRGQPVPFLVVPVAV